MRCGWVSAWSLLEKSTLSRAELTKRVRLGALLDATKLFCTPYTRISRLIMLMRLHVSMEGFGSAEDSRLPVQGHPE